MSDDGSDMQIRKFLKRVGVESHEVIAAALAAAAGEAIPVKMALYTGGAEKPAKTFESSMNAA